MTGFNYMGPSEDGRQYKFSNDAGATFPAYVPDSLIPMLQSMAPGTRVEGEIETKTSKTGNTYTQVKSINGQRGQRSGGGQQGGGGGFKPRGYDNKRFVEQVCVAAIGAGIIKDSKALEAWATGAYTLIQKVAISSVKGEVKAAAPAATPNPSQDAGQSLDDPLPF